MTIQSVQSICQDWKSGNHLMGSNVEKYQPTCPSPEVVNVNKFPLQVAKLETIPGKSGWSKYRVSLPHSFRTLYYGDVLFGPDWRELISDFDKKPLCQKLFLQPCLLYVLTNTDLLETLTKKTCSGLKARRPCRAPPSSARWWRLSLSPGLTSRAHWMTWFRPTTSRTKSLAGQLEPPYMLYKLWRRVESLVKLKMDSSSSSSLSMPQLRLLCRIATVTSGTFDFKPIHSRFNIFHVQDWNSHIPNFWFQTCTFSFQHYLSTLSKNCNASEPEVAHTPLAVPITDFQLGHGTAKFQKADKIAAMKREGKSGRDNLNVAVVYWWTCLQRMDSKFKLPFLLNQSLWHLRISGSSWWQRCEVFRI